MGSIAPQEAPPDVVSKHEYADAGHVVGDVTHTCAQRSAP